MTLIKAIAVPQTVSTGNASRLPLNPSRTCQDERGHLIGIVQYHLRLGRVNLMSVC